MRISRTAPISPRGAGLPPEASFPHNGGVTNQQMASACPRCGKTDAVHSIQELAALASSQLGQQPPGSQTAGWAAEPQQGPVPGWAAEPQAGPLPGPGSAGSAGGLGSAGSLGGLRSRPYRDTNTRYGESPLDALGEDIAGAALSAAAGFVGRAIGRRVERAMTQKVIPTLAAGRETMLRTQIEIAQRHPDLCACMDDDVIFLAGGSRALPLPNLMTVTVEQADQMVAQLRDTVT
jgi:hypothetical protein